MAAHKNLKEKRTTVILRKDQKKYCVDNHINISGLVRALLDLYIEEREKWNDNLLE